MRGLSIELKEILGTDNYLLIGYRDCEVTIETSLESMLCPYHFSGSNTCFSNKGCHLMSAVPFLWTPGHNEIDKEQVPRLFLVYLEQRNLAAKYVSLIVPQFQNGSTRALKRIFMGSAKNSDNQNINTTRIFNRDFFNYISKIKDIIYDNKNSDLYIIGQDGDHINYKIFYYKVVSPRKPEERFEFVYQETLRLPEKAKHLIGASYDTYTDKFYFHIKGQTNSEIYYFDSTVFRRTVEDSLLWKLETTLAPVLNASIFGNGILYVNDNPDSGSYRHFIGPLSRNQTSIMCRSSSEVISEKLFVIKDYDYCRIYSGKNYSKETCDYLISQGKISANGFNSGNEGSWGRFVTWIIIISTLLNFIFIVVITLRCIGPNKNEPLSKKIKLDKDGKIEYYPTYLSDQSGFSF
uniref:Uncharacterized protein n=1 Tax=Strongyloides venezuelensis TaxID=75913 RepID=A0A0K0F9H9_STRVS